MDETDTDVPANRELAQRVEALPHERINYVEVPANLRVVEDSSVAWKHNRFKVSVLTMVLISLSTFFFPMFNGLLAGAFGGFHAGQPRRALGAALVTAVVVPVTLYVAFDVFGVGTVRIFSGLGFTAWSVLHAICVFIGALAGASSRPLFSGDIPIVYAPPAPLLAEGEVEPALPEGSRDFSRDLPLATALPPNGPVRGE
ncbi:hypothetical protein [Corallococcus silvisoli]|uniref:hypothetical protein n=1 Tax=Corallococcus silvisoli TaxID=2697031 RepID=UPI0013769864|nr:hypothetical protein [Corallococcus silvisoli]NBD10039.1 hypothetical protein [Corallococcus silvisoli]